jgi:hypothetical protein
VDRRLAVATARLRRVGRGRRTPPAAPALPTAASGAALWLDLGALIALIIPIARIILVTPFVPVVPIRAMVVIGVRGLSVGVAVRLRLGRFLRIRA